MSPLNQHMLMSLAKRSRVGTVYLLVNEADSLAILMEQVGIEPTTLASLTHHRR